MFVVEVMRSRLTLLVYNRKALRGQRNALKQARPTTPVICFIDVDT